MPLVTVVNEQSSDVALTWLITVNDPAGVNVLRGAADISDVTSRGDVYTAFPFELVLPTDDGQRPQALKVVVANVARELTDVIRSTLSPPLVKFELVLSDAPDVVEKTLDFFMVRGVSYNVQSIEISLAPSDIFMRRTVSSTYNQFEFPALFWGQ